jgi:hypothetical protein
MGMRPKWWRRRSRPARRAGDSPALRASGHEQPTAGRFTRLPERVDPKDVVESQPVEPPRDPRGGRDTERDFLLRYGAGGDDTPWDPTDG